MMRAWQGGVIEKANPKSRAILQISMRIKRTPYKRAYYKAKNFKKTLQNYVHSR